MDQYIDKKYTVTIEVINVTDKLM